MIRVTEGLPGGILRPYRDHHCEALDVRFGQKPRIGRMSELGQTATFDTRWPCVWNAPMNRHSGPNVG